MREMCGNYGGNIWEGYSMARPNLLLFEADDATHQGYGMEVGQRKLEGWITLIVGYEEDVVSVRSLAHSLDEGTLVGVEHIGLVPLEEDVGERDLLARHEVA